MPVTIKVNGTTNSLVHKGSGGISTATMPDVCKTPTPGGPVPMPYPNISQSATLDKGSTTVKADGGMTIAIKGSEFSMSSGDEPGSIGGVKSGTFIKESTWILYSFDVKMEGQGVCRLSDKKFQNHENTVDMAGEMQAPVAGAQGVLQDMACECDEQVKPGPNDTCRSLGSKKHECMNHKISQHRAPPKLQGEKPYDVKTGQPGTPPNLRSQLIDEPRNEFFKRIKGKIYPDAAILDDYGRPARFVEFKFQCPAGVPTRKGGPPCKGTAPQDWRRGQRKRTIELGEKQVPPVTAEPDFITNEKCS